MEYHHPASDRAVVYCFRALAPESEKPLRIRGLEQGRKYKVTYENTGATAMFRGGEDVTVRLPEQNRSEMLWIEPA